MTENQNAPLNDKQLEKVSGGADEWTYIIYTVVKGDTLSKIARRFHVTVQAIVDENDIPNPNLIRVGQELQIPYKM